eukprot:GHVT01039557.1.p1 GENE.GHVT01039557.1~~GHVT01039557.1.p1  ORF type:complete len:422 (-),score=113.15 GHVT01039557.1:132-1397(-)
MEAGQSKNQILGRFLKYLNSTGSPYHSVDEIQKLLIAKGFHKLDPSDPWGATIKASKSGRFFATQNHSSIIAFVRGAQPANEGFRIAATHTDSPCLRLRPHNNNIEQSGYLQLGVECYGGGLWHTWFDRGLGLAGKVVLKKEAHRLEERLVRFERPLAVLPNLAIHLQTAEERGAFKINKELHLRPVLCTADRAAPGTSQGEICGAQDRGEAKKEDQRQEENEKDAAAKPDGDAKASAAFSGPILRLIANELGCKEEEIVDADLCLMDATPARLCGIFEELVEGPRLDNLVSTWCNFEALAATEPSTFAGVNVAVAFDHEEVGSQSWTGADSDILTNWLRRFSEGLGEAADLERRLGASFLISVDMAHALHPNYADKHQAQHKPMINKASAKRTPALAALLHTNAKPSRPTYTHPRTLPRP